jgi:hypothetical protein
VRAIITGTTGMVGEGVLLECLSNPEVEQVLILNRRPGGFTHPKLKEIIVSDFYNMNPIKEQLKGYNACYFCLGTSSVGMSEADYRHVTYDLTMHMGQILPEQNADMTFCYISGSGTDSTEQGRLMWARVKGKTENDLMKLPFKQVYAFRPGFMKATKGQKNVLKAYPYFAWMYPALRALAPNFACTLKEVGQAMINTVTKGYPKKVLEVKDIVALAKA